MTYSLTFGADMGPANTGLTLRAQLYDSDGTPNGAEITTGFVEVDSTNLPGYYEYVATIPDDHTGAFGIYNNADKTQRVGFSVNPVEVELVAIGDALLKRDIDQVESAAAVHSLTTAILKAVSRIRDNAGTLEIYETDGTTVKMSQVVTTDDSLDPVDELGVGT